MGIIMEHYTEKPNHTAKCSCGQMVRWIYDKNEKIWFAPFCWRCVTILSMKWNLMLGRNYDVDGNLTEQGAKTFIDMIIKKAETNK
jgi:hypothetical protein